MRKYSLKLDNTEEKNPASDFGTPLDLAQHEGHTEVVRLIQNAKSLIALKNSNKKLERAVRSNKLRLWKRFCSLNKQIIRFMIEVNKLDTKLVTFVESLLNEGHFSECDIIVEASRKLGKSQREVHEKLRSQAFGKRLRNAWKKDTGKYSDMRKNIITIDNALESLQSRLSLPESEEIKKEVSCFTRQNVPPVMTTVAHCQHFCVLLSAYFR